MEQVFADLNDGPLAHLPPEGWHREREWLNLFEAACGPPAQAA
jgi:hypothetical protein